MAAWLPESTSRLSPAAGTAGTPWAARQHEQAHTILETGGHGCSRALQGLVKAQSRGPDHAKELQTLKDVLQGTAFGQVFEPAYVERMLSAAECRILDEGEELSLTGVTDGLYVVAEGSVEVVEGPDDSTRPLEVTVRGAQGLPGDSATDKLDPYVVVLYGGGSKQEQTHVAMDAGPNPNWNWSKVISFGYESEIEFIVMEYDTFSRHDLLCRGKIGISEFEKHGFDGTVQLEVPEDARTGLESENSGKGARSQPLCTTGGSLRLKLAWASEVRSERSGASTKELQVPADSDPEQRRSFRRSRTDAGPTFLQEGDPSAPKAATDMQRSMTMFSPAVKAKPVLQRSMTSRMTLRSATLKAMAASKIVKTMTTPTAESPTCGRKGSAAPWASKDKPQHWRLPGYRFGAGRFFGLEEGGGELRMLEDSVLMFVPRFALRDALRAGREELRQQQVDFIKRWLPGACNLEKRALESLSGAFKEERFPRGHVLCIQGQAASSDTRRMYVIRSGTCRILQAPLRPSAAAERRARREEDQAAAGAAVVRSSPRALGIEEEPSQPRVLLRAAPIGLLGEGALAGCAASIFGLPEPLTVVADEPVTVLRISVAERPVSVWPKEVVRALHEAIKRQAEWHGSRAQLAMSAASTNSQLFGDSGRGPPAWSITDSPFLRHKELSTWQTENVRERFVAEGWIPREAKSGGGCAAPDRALALARSCPTLPSLGGGGGPASPSASWQQARPSSSGGGAAGSDVGRPMSAAEAAKRPLSAWTPVKTPGGDGLGGIATPWGSWGPSGMLPQETSQDSKINQVALRARARRGERTKERRTRAAPAARREEQQLHTLNLRCGSDLRTISSLASKAAVAKMLKMQQRQRAGRLEASAAHAAARPR